MQVQLGTRQARNKSHELGDVPSVTYIHIPDHYTVSLDSYGPAEIAELKSHLLDSLSSGVTHRPDDEALLTLTSAFRERSDAPSPYWLWVGPGHNHDGNEEANPEAALAKCSALAQHAAAYWGIDPSAVFIGYENLPDVEDTHFTRSGPPGVGPAAGFDASIKMLLTNAGGDYQAANQGGGITGITGTASATAGTATTASLTTAAIASVATNLYQYARIYTPTAWANIISHTSGTTPVFTLDRWYAYATPGGSAASTPTSTTTWVIADSGGGSGAWFMGLSATISAVATHTALAGEITTSGGGLIRKQCAWAHTAGTSTYTETVTFTANGSDSLPVTIGQMGLFPSMIQGAAIPEVFETALSATATLATSGDQLTVTETVTMSA